MVAVLPIDQALFDRALATIEQFHNQEHNGSDSVVWIEAYKEFAHRLEKSQIIFQAEIAQLNIDDNAPGN
jgi:hypothetical protein